MWRKKVKQTTIKDRINYKRYRNDQRQFMMMMLFSWLKCNILLTLLIMSTLQYLKFNFGFVELCQVFFLWGNIFLFKFGLALLQLKLMIFFPVSFKLQSSSAKSTFLYQLRQNLENNHKFPVFFECLIFLADIKLTLLKF